MKEYKYTKDFEDHKKGELIEADRTNYHEYIHPLVMRGVLKETGKKAKKEEKPVIDMDLNRDGVVDHKDVSIGATVMAHARKIKKEGVD